jgi:DAK2 domain fusion protein YloV
MIPTLSSSDIPRLVESGLSALKRYQNEINKLNVFPVPDGDTGTNLVLTMQAILEEIAKCPDKSMSSLSKALTFGSLMGARGNAGVILSQIVRGICDAIGSSEILSSLVVIEALQNAVRIAYQAVRKPVEGTMLTVIKDAALAAQNLAKQNLNIDLLLEKILVEANRSLERTPDLLPVLKEAGVVDAGGYGLVVIGEGILASLKGQELEEANLSYAPSISSEEEISLEFKYCTEFLLKGKDINSEDLQKELESWGDSVMVVGSPDLARVHVHSNHPGKVLEIAVGLGSLSQVRINNMEEQVEERTRMLSVTAQKKEIGIVAVASGTGIKKILASLGVEKVVDGGQGMNPSTAEILEAIEESPSDQVLVLPNNKNIILAAQSAIKESKKKALVIPTKSIPEAFSALLSYDPQKSLDVNAKMMEEACANVKTGEITLAVRDSKLKVGQVKRGDYIGLCNHEIKVVSKSLKKTVQKLIDMMLDEDDETITLLSGADASLKEAQDIMVAISKNYPHLEVELHSGGQPLYHLLIGIE